MKKMLIFILMFITISAYTDVINITNGEWPPYLSEKSHGYGIVSRIVTDAFNEEGIGVKYGFFLWKEAYRLAESGDWDGSVVWTKNSERKKDFYYSEEPVIELKTVFFHRKDFQFKWKNYYDLKDRTIGITKGYYYGNEFSNAMKDKVFKVEKEDSDLINFRKLLRGKIDLFACEFEVGYNLIANYLKPQDYALITNSPRPLNKRGYYLLISKKAKNGRELMEQFDRGIRKLKARDKYEDYFSK